MPITSFTGEHKFLSNFWPVEVTLDGISYPSVEHAYQAAKFLDPVIRKVILSCPTAKQAKKVGKLKGIREDWDKIRLQVMFNLVADKFNHPELGAKLLDTKNKQLVEGNWWGDKFWGVCNGVGENHLGRILMNVRTNLRNKS